MTAEPQHGQTSDADLPAEPSAPAVPQQPAGSQEPAGPQQPVPAAPPQRMLQRTRISGIWISIACFAVVLLLLLVFILQNGETVGISYLGLHGHLPLGVALLLAAVCGVLLLVFAATARILQLRAAARRHRRADAAARRQQDAASQSS